jgi:hypothetical protein
VNLLGDNIDTINKNTETLIGARKEVGLEVQVEKRSICWYLVTRTNKQTKNLRGP